VVPTPEVLRWTESVAASARRGADGLRWTRADQRHVTLQFLGPVDDADALIESVAGSVRRVAPFLLVLGGAGAFPSPRRASVLWLGVTCGADELGALAAAVTGATGATGATGQIAHDRPYRPHLTLARSAAARDLRPVVGHLSGHAPAPPFRVDDAVLYDSETRRDGAVYVERARFPLGGP
jgi:2'-5' RNA ligase